MGELAKIESFRTDLALAETYEEIKLIGDAANAYAELMRRQNVSEQKQQELGEFRIEIAKREGAWLDEFYSHGGDRKSKIKVTNGNLDKMPATKKNSSIARTIANADDKQIEKPKKEVKQNNKIITPKIIAAQIKKDKNKEIKREREFNELEKKSIQKPIIIHADCLSILDNVPDIDLLIADPPYFTDGNFIEAISIYLSKVKNTGQAYVFMSANPDEVKSYLNMNLHDMILSQILVWNYNNTGQRQPNVKYNSNYQLCFYYRGIDAPDINKPADGKEQYACQTINAPDARRDERYFKWQKPDDLIEHYIKNSSKPGDFVFDPFAGSGTTLIVASKLGRIAMGCDIDNNMIKICIERGCKDGKL